MGLKTRPCLHDGAVYQAHGFEVMIGPDTTTGPAIKEERTVKSFLGGIARHVK